MDKILTKVRVAEMACRYKSGLLYGRGLQSCILSYGQLLCSDVDEGHYQIPSRCTPEILSARLLNITPSSSKTCANSRNQFTMPLGKLSLATLQRVKGIGEKKAAHIKEVLDEVESRKHEGM